MGGCFSQGSEPERPYYPPPQPQQPDRPCHGEYRCPVCKRWWDSEKSWPGFPQQCKKCLNYVFPHMQTPLRRYNGLDKSNRGKPHPQELCGKCRSLGRFCGSSGGGGGRDGYGRSKYY